MKQISQVQQIRPSHLSWTCPRRKQLAWIFWVDERLSVDDAEDVLDGSTSFGDIWEGRIGISNAECQQEYRKEDLQAWCQSDTLKAVHDQISGENYSSSLKYKEEQWDLVQQVFTYAEFNFLYPRRTQPLVDSVYLLGKQHSHICLYTAPYNPLQPSTSRSRNCHPHNNGPYLEPDTGSDILQATMEACDIFMILLGGVSQMGCAAMLKACEYIGLCAPNLT